MSGMVERAAAGLATIQQLLYPQPTLAPYFTTISLVTFASRIPPEGSMTTSQKSDFNSFVKIIYTELVGDVGNKRTKEDFQQIQQRIPESILLTALSTEHAIRSFIQAVFAGLDTDTQEYISNIIIRNSRLSDRVCRILKDDLPCYIENFSDSQNGVVELQDT